MINFLKSFPWALLALASGVAHSEIYSCRGDRGTTVYQNFPCAFDSLGSVPATATLPGAAAANANTQTRDLTTRGDSTARGKFTHARDAAAPSATAAAGVPHVGSMADEVRKTWGEPDEVLQDEPPKGRIEIWRYKDGRSVEIDRRQRVIAVQL